MAQGVQRQTAICFVARDVNLKNTGSTDIVGSPVNAGNGVLRKTSQLFRIKAAWIVIKTLTGTLSAGCTFTIDGVNKGSTGSVQTVNVVASNTLSTSVVKQSVVVLTVVSPALVCDVGSASGSIAITISAGATVTTLTADVWIEGIIVD